VITTTPKEERDEEASNRLLAEQLAREEVIKDWIKTQPAAMREKLRKLWPLPDENGKRIGYMADEVALYRPDAVFLHPSGYLMVDYLMLNNE
jgi:hypothetical protein